MGRVGSHFLASVGIGILGEVLIRVSGRFTKGKLVTIEHAKPVS